MALKALSMRGIAEGLPGVLGNNWEQTTKYCREPGNLNFFKGTQEQVYVEDGGGRRLKTDMLNREEIYKKKPFVKIWEHRAILKGNKDLPGRPS